MEPEVKNKHSETPEETEEYVKELETDLQGYDILVKFISSGALLLSYAVARVSLWWLMIFAATGSGAAGEHETALGTSFLVIGYNLSYVFCLLFITGATVILFLGIWGKEIAMLSKKIPIAINGASKELYNESKKED